MFELNANVIESTLFPQFKDKIVDFLRSTTDNVIYHFYRFIILPGFCDVHVHFREPGFLIKRDGCIAVYLTEAITKGEYEKGF